MYYVGIVGTLYYVLRTYDTCLRCDEHEQDVAQNSRRMYYVHWKFDIEIESETLYTRTEWNSAGLESRKLKIGRTLSVPQLLLHNAVHMFAHAGMAAIATRQSLVASR